MISTIIKLCLSWLRSILRERARQRHIKRQGFLCLCPSCRQDMDGPVWSLTRDAGICKATCAHCGRVSHWLMAAPVPILLTTSTGETPT